MLSTKCKQLIISKCFLKWHISLVAAIKRTSTLYFKHGSILKLNDHDVFNLTMMMLSLLVLASVTHNTLKSLCFLSLYININSVEIPIDLRRYKKCNIHHISSTNCSLWIKKTISRRRNAYKYSIYFMQKGPTAKQNCQNTTPIRRQSVSSPTYNLSWMCSLHTCASINTSTRIQYSAVVLLQWCWRERENGLKS